MSLITSNAVSKSWSDVDVLTNVHVSLAPQERVGLVGPNGQGKTTLVRILAGLEPPTEGTIDRKSGLRIGYLPQDPPALEGATLHEAMLAVFADLHRLEAEVHRLAGEIEGSDDEALMARYGRLQHEFEVRGGYTYSRKIEQVLTGLSFERDVWERPLATLSGGQRTRAYLGRLLLEDPDVLLLDEPTNHLDYQTVEWLEEYLQSFAGAVIVVSHDRYFLDRVTTRTWEVSGAAVECYRGNYSHYLTQRDERFKERSRRWQAQQEFIAETEDFIRRFLAGQRSKEAKGRRTRLERFMKTEAIPKPREHQHISVRFNPGVRTGDFVLHMVDLKAGYDAAAPLVHVEKLDIQRGQRVAIVGPNGCGKTTLLRTILGQLPALAGQARLGAGVKVGYLSQTHAELVPDMTAVDAVRQGNSLVSEYKARSLLGGLLMGEEDAFKRIDQLSGGQRSRVVLARLMLAEANVLVMDEPTNHLDILSQEVLQDVLSEFDGTVIFVSHDRYLIQALASHIWAMHDGVITELKGDWNKYLAWRDKVETAGPAGATQGDAAKSERIEQYDQRREQEKQRRKAANEIKKIQRQFEQTETRIHALEDKLKTMSEEISAASASGDMERVRTLGADYACGDSELRGLYAQWEQMGAALEETG
ncbi:MAG: ABC-F family ATP-binding cassette domain-containing protein [Planctomycetaceae bacterium]|nr:ABC-F family ATP-binding cassette domain-containing protein [Planctomycetaceae bacterium]